jgi:hypothetical protein
MSIRIYIRIRYSCKYPSNIRSIRQIYYINCPHEAERRTVLREALEGQLDPSRLLDTPRGALVASKWMIRSGRILQFQLAGALLYEDR